MTALSTNGDTLIRCGERSIRNPCKYCGRKAGLYWGHDPNAGGYKHCPKHPGMANFVMVEADGTRHDCRGTGEHDTTQAPEDSEATPVVTATVTSLPAPDKTDAGAQLASLIGQLAKGTVDEATVRSMIKGELNGFSQDMIDTVGSLVSDKLAKLTVPTVLEIRKPNGEPKVLKGVHKDIPKILSAIQADQAVLMVGPMGTGKSTIASHVADAMEREFSFIAVGPQTSKSDIVGYMTADGTYVPTLFRHAYERGGVFLIDELDSGHPGVLTILNAAMSNGHMAFPDGMVKRHDDAIIMAAANTYGRGPDRMYVGRQAIDAATLDRFCVVDVEVDEALEQAMCYGTGLDASKVDDILAYVRTLRSNAERNKMAVGFSPRASHGVCALLAAGWSLPDAIQSRVRRGLTDQDWHKVTSGASTPR
jgi:cobaltochelatase CobS